MNKMSAERLFHQDDGRENELKRPVSERGRRRVAILLGSATIAIVAGLVALGAHGQSGREAGDPAANHI